MGADSATMIALIRRLSRLAAGMFSISGESCEASSICLAILSRTWRSTFCDNGKPSVYLRTTVLTMCRSFPHYSASTLTAWFKSKYPVHLDKVLRYFVDKTVMYIEMMDAAEITTKNACVVAVARPTCAESLSREFARVFGVDFASVMSRGSQFKVESFMFRIAKPESFVLISPSREAVSHVL